MWAGAIGLSGFVLGPGGRPMSSLRLLGGAGPPLEGRGRPGSAGGVVERWREVLRLKIHFPFGSGCRCSPGNQVAAARWVEGVRGGRVMTVSFVLKDSPRTGLLRVRGGQTSQCWPGYVLQMTMSVGRMSCGRSIDICRALFTVGLGSRATTQLHRRWGLLYFFVG